MTLAYGLLLAGQGNLSGLVLFGLIIPGGVGILSLYITFFLRVGHFSCNRTIASLLILGLLVGCGLSTLICCFVGLAEPGLLVIYGSPMLLAMFYIWNNLRAFRGVA